MTTLESAQFLVERLAAKLAADLVEAEKIRAKKRPLALAAAKLDEGAASKLARLNAVLAKLLPQIEDGEAALEGARAELAAAELVARRGMDLERAAEVEVSAEELATAMCQIDLALAALVVAFQRRDEVAQRLYGLVPALRRDAGLALSGEGAATRAARAHGLQRWLKLPWSGDARHEIPLAETLPLPAVTKAIQELRGGGEGCPSATKKREAA